MYTVESLGRGALPDDLRQATTDDVEAVLHRAAMVLGVGQVSVERVTSVLPGTCMPCTDIVAYAEGLPVLVAIPSMF
jgi:hypothetical protein